MYQRNICVPDQVNSVEACTILDVLNRVSSKWSISILIEAIRGPVRFTELERAVKGISRRMLTLTLRNLERDGLLVRTVYPTVPAKVEYTATDMARELYDSLVGLTGWAERHHAAIAVARDAYDRAAALDHTAPSTDGRSGG
ncbi:winged helix-turn-helix transcriptional regulator [Streptosporangium sp. NBC_01756]|uniref:winged helix-turn-helix transcriptional regulator n=1 Tax=Streptosporangium sp. NBC_01756 TaxID=2975950 RepID=UPI002DD87FF6|nr:helix-turn-helix domain-containing protein [Streptosporangium sp. NBC_01756]WSC88282.1 helix-turn-helix transcriptional regulator [Streptosporangium sp. NBC_01756]